MEKLPEEVLKFFKQKGAAGGKARAKKHSPAELSAWGKMGGRPKSAPKEAPAAAQKTTARKSGKEKE